MSKEIAPKNSNNKKIVIRKDPVPVVKPAKKVRASSLSRDTREDRGTRQAKTASNPQTLSRGR